MPKSLWNDSEAAKFKTHLELRVYTSRLLGKDPALVMHGGGNTSLKDEVTTLMGEKEPALFIKGSGWDLATIEKPGFPAVKMKPVLRLRGLSSLSDPDMMNELRTLLFRADAPDPSVETLLHAFIPHRFVDHTHADAVLALTNQPNGEEIIREIYGNRIGIVPYVMPGFQLAKLCADVFEANPQVEGLVLLKHGIFSFGESAKESYDRMLNLVNEAEQYLAKKGKPVAPEADRTVLPVRARAEWMQSLRAELLSRGQRFVLLLNHEEKAQAFAARGDAKQLSQIGPVTPDHVIRTKRLPLFVDTSGIKNIRETLKAALDQYAADYTKYFQKQSTGRKGLVMLDPFPRVAIFPGVGVVTLGATAKEARIAKDIYSHTMDVILAAQSIGRYQALPENDLFDVEYWVLEQAKLKLGPKRLPLSGKTAIVTGAASGIGLAIATEFAAQGANTCILDLNADKFAEIETTLKGIAKSGNVVKCYRADVTNREDVTKAFENVVLDFGGIDISVINAGIFPKSALIEDLPSEDWSKSLRVNADGAFNTAGESVRWMKLQGSGGDVVFIASKNVQAPGPSAGAYSVAKAAQTQLARVLALECGIHGIRVNTLHPHLIFDTGIWTPEVLAQRAAAYKMTVDEYKRNNLLKTVLDSHDVALAAFALVSGAFSKTTGAQIPLDGGSDRTL